MSIHRLLRLAACITGILLAGAAAQSEIIQTAHNLRMRSGPATEYPLISVIPAGAVMDMDSCGVTWCLVRWAGQAGYVSEVPVTLIHGPTVMIDPFTDVHAVYPVQDVVVVHDYVVVHCRYLFC